MVIGKITTDKAHRSAIAELLVSDSDQCVINFVHLSTTRSTVVSVIHEVDRDRDDFCWQHQYTGKTDIAPYGNGHSPGHSPSDISLTLACDRILQEVQMLRRTHDSWSTDKSTIINRRRRRRQPGGLQPGFALHLVFTVFRLCPQQNTRAHKIANYKIAPTK